ncbi:MAG TPA: C40 family peptidase, partial [Acidimicrobiales bacterium]|nr:C40 family peptidase [Acidimicrobiales bacterium]
MTVPAVGFVPARVAELQSRFAPGGGGVDVLGSRPPATDFAALLASKEQAHAAGPAAAMGGASSALGLAGGFGGAGTGTLASRMIDAAKVHLGVPYLWGGTDPAVGLDCSGFTQLVYREAGVEIPRVSRDQARTGTPVASIGDARPGDLLAFGEPVNHVAIYLGDGMMIHSPRRNDQVKIEPIDRPITHIRRLLPDTAWTPPTASFDPAAFSALGIGGGVGVAGLAGAVPGAGAAGAGGAAGDVPYADLFAAAGARHGVDPA